MKGGSVRGKEGGGKEGREERGRPMALPVLTVVFQANLLSCRFS